jgi:hypothetical protein
MKQLGMLVVLLITDAAVLLANTAVGLKPGKYEETATMEMNGKPTSRPGVHTKCIDSKDLEDPEAIFNERIFVRYKPDPTCTTHNLTNSGGRISYDEDCTNRKVHVDATVSGAEYSAVRSVTPKTGTTAFTYRMTGKRTGDCSK